MFRVRFQPLCRYMQQPLNAIQQLRLAPVTYLRPLTTRNAALEQQVSGDLGAAALIIL